MIVGMGTDLVEIARIERVLQKTDQAFARRVLMEPELSQFEQHRFPARFLAKRWAAKEAIAKALGTGIAQGVGFHQLQISHNAAGRPLVVLKGQALKVAQQLGAVHWHLSISDEQHYAVAFAIAETN